MSKKPKVSPGGRGPGSPSGREQAHPPKPGHDHACGCGHNHEHGPGDPPHGVEAHGHAPGHSHPHEGHHHDHGGHGHSPAAGAAVAVHAHGGETEFTRRFLLFLEMAVLILWAVAMVWFYASGRIDKYLVGQGTFRIQVLIAGLALGVLGWFNWSMRALNAGCGHDHSGDGDGDGDSCGHDHRSGGHSHAADGPCCGHDHGDHGHAQAHADAPDSHAHPHSRTHSHEHAPHAHDHSHEGTVSGRGMGLLLLALSVSAAVALTPDDFSDTYKKNMLNAYASQPATEQAMPAAYRVAPETSGGGLTLAQVEKVQPRNKDGNFEMDVMQLYYSGSDPEYARIMKGQGVETIGQIVRDTANPAPNRWRVFVLQVTCCAADARPYSVPVEFTGAVPPDLQEMGWYKLTGKVDYTVEKNAGASVLRAVSAQPTLRPKDQRTLF
ncbi:MAG: hypothetical protein V4726_06020 [Verrucomicrobiota bacterium]